jgi:hypothetical protein
MKNEVNNKFWKYAICRNVPEILAGAAGFEPTITGPKPVALPLGYAPLRAKYWWVNKD